MMRASQTHLVLFSCMYTWIHGSVLYDYSGSTLMNRADDECVQVTLSGAILFFSNTYNQLYVCTNGIISFNDEVTGYAAYPFPVADSPVIAAFWGDVDTSYYGYIYHREIESTLDEISIEVRTSFGNSFAASSGYLVTWYQVPRYQSSAPSAPPINNTFQAALVSDGTLSYALFNYDSINWITGEASSTAAQMGFDAGDSVNFYSHEWSRTNNIINIAGITNAGTPGRWVFSVHSATIVAAVDACVSGPCLNSGTCTRDVQDYTCDCAPGYTGLNCETNNDDCAVVTCENGGTCIDLVNSYVCLCVIGYTGSNCETNIDDCTDFMCYNGGICMDLVNSYGCLCDTGYTGFNCETNIDDCTAVMCENGGTCMDLVNSYGCLCVTGYTGLNCATNIDDCTAVTCENGGNCTDLVNSFECLCPTGYTGEYCEINIDDCIAVTCHNGGTCMDQVNSYVCNCFGTGFNGTNCEIDVNECDSNPCLYNSTCVENTVGSYVCDCHSEYTGIHCEIYIDTISPSTTPQSRDKRSNAMIPVAIVASVVAVVILVSCLIFAGIIFRRKYMKKKKKRTISSTNIAVTYKKYDVSS